MIERIDAVEQQVAVRFDEQGAFLAFSAKRTV